MKRKRILRMGEAIRRELSQMLLADVKDPRVGFCTVTRVEVSPDIRSARIFMTFGVEEGRKEEGLEGMRSAAPYLEREITHRLKLRYVPHFTFCYDEEWEKIYSNETITNA